MENALARGQRKTMAMRMKWEKAQFNQELTHVKCMLYAKDGLK